jgi:uncharacterized membrane protein HdeD (DUF308 family)
MVVAGILVLVNIYLLQWSWPTFIGALLIVIGLGKIMMCCSPEELKMLAASKKKQVMPAVKKKK